MRRGWWSAVEARLTRQRVTFAVDLVHIDWLLAVIGDGPGCEEHSTDFGRRVSTWDLRFHDSRVADLEARFTDHVP